MRKFLLFIFLFSFLSSIAQDSLKMVNYSVLNKKINTSYQTQANTQSQKGNIDSIVGYVNPVGNNFVFSVDLKNQTFLTIEIFSILGQRRMIKHFNPGKGISKFSMDVSSLPRGLYIVRFTDKNRQISLTRKLLKE